MTIMVAGPPEKIHARRFFGDAKGVTILSLRQT
jgi:hypothetical protein